MASILEWITHNKELWYSETSFYVLMSKPQHPVRVLSPYLTLLFSVEHMEKKDIKARERGQKVMC